MLAPFTRQLRQRLKTTGVGLGLLRLQLDGGRTKEARLTLAALQDDFQWLLHGVEGETKTPPVRPYASLKGLGLDMRLQKGANSSRNFRPTAEEHGGSLSVASNRP